MMSRFKFEPQSTAEVIRAALLMLIGFNVIAWDQDQQILAFAFLSILMTWVTRSFSIPIATVEDAGLSVPKLQSVAEDNRRVDEGKAPALPPNKLMSALLAGVVGASLLGAPACAGKNAPVLVGQTGLAIADGIGQMQVATKQLTEAGVVPPRTALTIQETLLRANDRLKPLPPLLRAIDAAQQANDPTAALVDQALALVQAVSGDLDLVIGGVPVSDAAKQLLALAQATRQTVITLLTNLQRLKAQE